MNNTAKSPQLKTCSRCKEAKTVDSFTINRARPDGLQQRCRACNKVLNAEYRKTEKGKDTNRKVSARLRKLPKWKAANKRYAKKYRQSEKGIKTRRAWAKSEKGKQAALRRQKVMLEKYPEKHRARLEVSRAVARGDMPRVSDCLCQACGKKAKHYHHYAGYKPDAYLKVVPLCIACHTKEHQ